MATSRFYFRRKTGYMSPYTLRDVVWVFRENRRRNLPVADLYVRFGARKYRLRKGEYNGTQEIR